jgi:hypothetical protein
VVFPGSVVLLIRKLQQLATECLHVKTVIVGEGLWVAIAKVG